MGSSYETRLCRPNRVFLRDTAVQACSANGAYQIKHVTAKPTLYGPPLLPDVPISGQRGSAGGRSAGRRTGAAW